MRGPHSTHGLPQFLKVILILLGDARVPRGICTRPLIRTGIFYRVSVRTVLLGIATLSGKSRQESIGVIFISFNFLASKVINDYTCENEFCKRAVRIELLHHIVELLPDSRVTLDRKFYEIPAQLKPINLDVSSVGVWTIAKLGTSKHYCCNINIIVAISFYKMVARNKSSACFLPFHLKRFFSLCIWVHLTLILVNFFINYFAI